MTTEIKNPFELFTDTTGEPLEAGRIFIGVAGLDAEANQISVFFDEAGTIPAAQPIATIAGYPSNGGTPTKIFVSADDYSITVQDKNLVDQYVRPSGNGTLINVVKEADTIAGAAALSGIKVGDVFLIEDRASSLWDVVSATGGLGFYEVDTTTVSGLQLVLRTNGEAVMNEFGNAGSGDWTAILQACFDYVNAGSATTVKINPRVESYKINSDVSHGGSVNIIADGVTIDATAGTFSSGAVLSISGSLTQIEDLSVNANVHDRNITLASTPSLVDNDVFIIYNPTDSSWNAARTNYRAGEFCRVYSVVGNVVTLWGGLYDSYVVANVDLHKLSACDVSIKGLNITAPNAAVNGLTISLATSLSLDGVKASNSTVRGISLSRCYNVSIIDTTALVNETASGTQYGISIGNCSNVSVIGSSLYGTRHSLNIGGGGATGSVTNRNVRISNMTLFNGELGGVAAADMHGNVEDVHYNNCSMHNGAVLSGKNVSYSNCTIYGQKSGMVIALSEIKGGNFKISDCTLITHAVPTNRGLIYGGAIAATDEDLTLEVVGCNFQAQDMTNQAFVRLDNSANPNKVNLYIGGGCVFQSTTKAVSIGYVRQYSGGLVDSDFLVVDGITANQDGSFLLYPDGNFSALSVLRLQSQSFKFEGTTTIGTSSAIDASPIVYKYAYPKVPTATLARSGRGSANLGRFTGGFAAPEAIWDVTTTGIQVGIFVEGGANFTAAQDFDIHGIVCIQDV